jgi:hypothetical protein
MRLPCGHAAIFGRGQGGVRGPSLAEAGIIRQSPDSDSDSDSESRFKLHPVTGVTVTSLASWTDSESTGHAPNLGPQGLLYARLALRLTRRLGAPFTVPIRVILAHDGVRRYYTQAPILPLSLRRGKPGGPASAGLTAAASVTRLQDLAPSRTGVPTSRERRGYLVPGPVRRLSSSMRLGLGKRAYSSGTKRACPSGPPDVPAQRAASFP